MSTLPDFRQYRWNESEGSPPLVMVLDDDVMGLDLYRTILTMSGFKATTASGVCDGLEKMQMQLPDVILSDDTMPDLSGFDFLDRIMEEPMWNHIPFAIHSSMPLEYSVGRCGGRWALLDGFLSRPFMPHGLLIEIRQMLALPFTARSARRDQRVLVIGHALDDGFTDALRTLLYPAGFIFHILPSFRRLEEDIADCDPGCIVLSARDDDMLSLLQETQLGSKFPVVAISTATGEYREKFFIAGAREVCHPPLTDLVSAIQNAQYRHLLAKGTATNA
jgi:CheY-like chemotaxis protein